MIKEIMMQNGDKWINISKGDYYTSVIMLGVLIILVYIFLIILDNKYKREIREYTNENNRVDEYIEWKLRRQMRVR